MELIFQNKYLKESVVLKKDIYANGGTTALCLRCADTGEPFMDITTNIPDIDLEDDELLIKNYSENEGVLEFLISNKLVEDTGRRISNGFVEIPVVKMTEELKKL